MSITFGPGGNATSFGKRKFPEELPEYLASMGLNGYEVECGRGVNISEKTYKLLPSLAKEHGIYISLHAPYFISLSGVVEETRLKSIDYILSSAKAAKALGAEKIVVHSGSCGKMTRERALELATDTLKKAQEALEREGLSQVHICPETMGKINQLGTLEEVIALCRINENFIPCVDFGHLNARTLGGIKSGEDYGKMLDAIQDKLGYDRLKLFHVHFSKIMYTAGGEKMHLTFENPKDDEGNIYGPDFEPLMEQFAKRKLTPSIICESAGTQAEDAAKMKKYYESLTA